MSIPPRRWLVNVIIVMSCLTPLISTAQVTIKEKISISPRNLNTLLATSAGDSTFIVRIDWDLDYEDPGVVALGSDYDYTCDYPIASVIEQGSKHGVYSVKYTPTGLYTLYVWQLWLA